MNLMRSICCLFAGCGVEESKPNRATKAEPAEADLGQTEAELEKTGKERMSHMEGSKTGKLT
jgi:hypothetical protein